jgi:peptidyl-prolyl cis-trans isomerase B (cyclophilin B)
MKILLSIMVWLAAAAIAAAGVAMEAKAEGLSSGTEKLLSVEELAAAEMDFVRVNFDTDKGSFVVAVYPKIAPLSAENFLRLVGEGFYDGIAVHRVVEGFVMQAGEPSEKQAEKEKLAWEFPDEVNYVHHDPATISFAKMYDTEKTVYIPNSAGAQFFINLGDNRRLDENFTVFGRVVWGMETVLVTEVGDVIKRAYIINPL